MRGIDPKLHAGIGSIFFHGNRIKRGLVLDLKKPEGLQAFFKLVEKADVAVCNIRPQALQTKPLAQFAQLFNVAGSQSALAPEDLTIGPQRCTSALLMSSMTSGLVPMML